jgi:hypothetical protein
VVGVAGDAGASAHRHDTLDEGGERGGGDVLDAAEELEVLAHRQLVEQRVVLRAVAEQPADLAAVGWGDMMRGWDNDEMECGW